jgi:hypothetical protein
MWCSFFKPRRFVPLVTLIVATCPVEQLLVEEDLGKIWCWLSSKACWLPLTTYETLRPHIKALLETGLLHLFREIPNLWIKRLRSASLTYPSGPIRMRPTALATIHHLMWIAPLLLSVS